MLGERACDACGSRSQHERFVVDGFSIVECDVCGLVFVDSEPRPGELVSRYDESYEDAEQPGYGGYAEAESRKRLHDHTLLTELGRLTSRGDLLEVGCAYGYFLDEARPRLLARARRRAFRARRTAGARAARLEVARAAFTEFATEPGTVDAIAVWDVIEHLPNARETLQRACAGLRPRV